jgi:hypothetical protein
MEGDSTNAIFIRVAECRMPSNDRNDNIKTYVGITGISTKIINVNGNS